jgi:glycine/D-amino acid oxidase-like deaminating enzyme/nitrite reductase/ring-hydroxylating ferredoxin subunit
MHGGESYWIASTPAPRRYPTLAGELSVETAVVGGGIVGLTTALRLAQNGIRVALIEASALARGVSGYTTGKVTGGHRLVYSHLRRTHGERAMCLYAQAQLAALAAMAQNVHELDIECDLERVANYVYAETEDELAQLQDELDAACDAGLDAELELEPAVPFPAVGAVRLAGQAQFHPRKYLFGLADALLARGGLIFEQSRVTELEADDDPVVVRTETGTVRARNVVLATHVPITNRGLFFTRVHPRRSYVVAARMRDGIPFDGMWINVGEPTRSLRTAADGQGGHLVLACGEGHRVGQEEDADERYAHLERFLLAYLGDADVTHRWSTQDAFSVDGLPYVGRIGGESGAVLTATGFGGWGMTNGTVAGMLLSDELLGWRERWADLFDAGRAAVAQSALRFLRENANVAARLVAGKLARHDDTPADVLRGEGRLVDMPDGTAAVYRTPDGELLAVAAECTHMGCLVAWNAAESSWDCPCHGSRFGVDGSVLEGPATRPLETVELELAEEGGGRLDRSATR